MNIADIVVIVLGLCLFEVISSIDNAVVNADVLATMQEKSRRWFLVYGILIAVFVIRGLLPLIIVYFSTPGLGLWGAISATFSSDPAVRAAIEHQAPVLLAGGGIYLAYLFLHWLFVETKEYAFFLESYIHKKLYFWFFALASALLLAFAFISYRIDTRIVFGALVGSTAFFITHGFKVNAEEAEKSLTSKHLSDVSKILYLEVLDATFSVDGVLGAFAFTLSVPLILLGNGLGAYIVRWFTIKGIKTVKKYRYLKNGAMYSIGVLGLIMIGESLSVHIPKWMPTLTTFAVVGLFFWLSKRELEAKGAIGS